MTNERKHELLIHISKRMEIASYKKWIIRILAAALALLACSLIAMCFTKDYTGFFKNLSGSLSLTDVMRVVSSPAGIKAGDKSYDSFEQAMQELKGRYSVVSIKGDRLTIEVRPAGEGTPSEDWIEKYEQESGEEVSFF